jgi:DNA replication protein DnaC
MGQLVPILATAGAFLTAQLLRKSAKSVDEITKLTCMVQNVLSDLKKTCEKFIGKLWIVPVAAFGYWFLSQYANNKVILAVVLASLSFVFGKSIWGGVSSFFKSVFEPQEQDGFGAAAGSVESLIAALLCFIHLPKGGIKAVPELMKRFATFTRTADGLSAFFSTCMNIAEKLINMILRAFGKEAVHFGDVIAKEVKAWTQRYYDAERYIVENCTVPIEKILEFQGVITDGLVLKASISDDRMRNEVQRCIDRLTIKMQPFQSGVTASKTFRVEPEFVLLYGKSKQGKTTLLTYISMSLLTLSQLEKDPTMTLKHLWQKGSSQYFESYHGQKVLVLDDVFQEKAVPGVGDSEYMQIIRMVGNWSYPLNMAAVESKAKFFFTSPLIVGTTNCSGVDATNAAQVINCPEALARRVHRCIQIEASPEFSKDGGLDYVKLAAVIEQRQLEMAEKAASGHKFSQLEIIRMFPWEAWTCYRHDWSGGGSRVGGAMDLYDFIVETSRVLAKKQKQHLTTVEGMRAFNDLLSDAAPLDLAEEGPIEEQSPPIDMEWLGNAVVGLSCTPDQVQENLSAVQAKEFAATEKRLVDDGLGIDSIPLIRRAAAIRYHPDRIYQRYPDLTDDEREDKLRDEARIMSELNNLYDRVEELERVKMEWHHRYNENNALMFKLRSALIVTLTCVSTFVGVTYFKKGCNALTSWTINAVMTLMSKIFGVIKDILLAAYRAVLGLLGLNPKPEEQSNIKEKQRALVKKGIFSSKCKDQSGFDGSQHNHKHDNVYYNTYKLVIGCDEPIVLGQLIFVEGSMAMMPMHFLTNIDKAIVSGRITEATPLHFVSARKSEHDTTVTIGMFLKQRTYGYEEADVVFMDFQDDFKRAHRKITKQFLDAASLERAVLTTHPVRLDVCDTVLVDGKRTPMRNSLYAPSAFHVREITVGANVRRDMIGYKQCTEVGYCGAPLMLANPNDFGGRVFLGIHIAGHIRGSSREGYSTPVTLEMVERARDKLKTIRDAMFEDMEDRGVEVGYVDEEVREALEECGLIGGSISLIGVVEQPVHIAPNTKLKKSFLNEECAFGPSPQRPAHLRPIEVEGVMRYPMVEGISKYQSPYEYREVPGMQAIVELATQRLRAETSLETFRRILTFEEAVEGVEGLKLKGINRSTSAGFPYIYDVRAGKTEFFGKEAEYDFSSDKCSELRDRVNYVLAKAKEGVRLAHICVDFLKDELRPHHKVDACQTRIISGSPLDYVVACRMMFGAFIAACFKHHTVSGMCPGINPYTDWFKLARFLRGDKRTKHFDGDFKGFDASEQPYIHWRILAVINQWYDDGPENAQVRRVLWLDLVHSRHLTGLFGSSQFVVQWDKSLPSGHPLTTIVNSLYSLITITACYVHTTGDWTRMWERAAIATFGDDNLAGADDDVAEVFNQVTVAEKMHELFGLVYTSGAKDGTLVETKSLEECTFLKRSFWFDPSNQPTGWAAPLDINSFLYTAYYYKNSRNSEVELAAKLEDALGELCLHKPEVWDEWAPKIHQAMRELNHTPALVSREAWRIEMSNRIDFWF